MVSVFTGQNELKKVLSELRTKGQSIGFVPTMGALHQGHLSLMQVALQQNDALVVSIFVNPTQFDNKEDLEKYPRTLERDVKLLEKLPNDIIVYAPSVNDIYEGNTKAENFHFDGLEHEMEGRFRDGHFNGVGTIVKRLFEIVNPDNAYFGEKDYQQLMIIKKLVEKYNLAVNIHGCDIHREKDGLAMSSRNERLKPQYREAAPFIYKTLTAAKSKFGTIHAKELAQWVEDQFSKQIFLKLEYFVIADAETLKPTEKTENNKTYRAFIAVYADDIRLIDNIALN